MIGRLLLIGASLLCASGIEAARVRRIEIVEEGELAPITERGSFGVGMDWSMVNAGLGPIGRYWVTENLGAQAGYIAVGYFTGFSLRGIWEFTNPEKHWHPYIGAGYMNLGAKQDYGTDSVEVSLNVPAIFAGIEGNYIYSWWQWAPNLYWSYEIVYSFKPSATVKYTSERTEETSSVVIHQWKGFYFGFSMIYYFGKGFGASSQSETSETPQPSYPEQSSDREVSEPVSRTYQPAQEKSEREIQLEREVARLRQQVQAPASAAPQTATSRPAGRPSSQRKSYALAVANLEYQNMLPEEAAQILDILRQEIGQVSNRTVMSRREMEEALGEHNIPVSGCAAEECAKTIGENLNIRKVVFGSISRDAEAYYLSVFILNTATGQSSYGSSAKGNTLSELAEDTRNLVGRIRNRL